MYVCCDNCFNSQDIPYNFFPPVLYKKGRARIAPELIAGIDSWSVTWWYTFEVRGQNDQAVKSIHHSWTRSPVNKIIYLIDPWFIRLDLFKPSRIEWLYKYTSKCHSNTTSRLTQLEGPIYMQPIRGHNERMRSIPTTTSHDRGNWKSLQHDAHGLTLCMLRTLFTRVTGCTGDSWHFNSRELKI